MQYYRTMPTRDFIEACYQRRENLAEWARGLLAQAVKLHGRQVGFGAYFYRLGPGGQVEISQLFSAPGGDLADDPRVGPRAFAELINSSPLRESIIPATYGSDNSFLLLSDLPERIGRPLGRGLPPGARDSMCMRGVFQAEGFHLCVLGAGRFRPNDRKRRYLNDLSSHVAAGFRVQRALAGIGSDPEAALAIASADGRLLHGSGRFRERDAAEAFLERVKTIDRLRCRRTKQDPEGAERLWEAFADGEYSLVESLDTAGRRMILAVRTTAPVGSALTLREQRVLEGVVRGSGNKAIGAALGMSASTAAVHLQSAMKKLGFRSRQSLVACFASRRGGSNDGATRGAKVGPGTAVGSRNES